MSSRERYQQGGRDSTPRLLARRWWGAELRVVGPGGVIEGTSGATLPAPETALCRECLGNTEGARRCGASIARAFDRARAAGGEPVRHPCHLDFDLVACASDASTGVVACGVREGAMDADGLARMEERLAEIRITGAKGPIDAPPGIGAADLRRVADVVQAAALELVDPDQAPGARPKPRQKRAPDGPVQLIGQSVAMLELQRLIERVAPSEATVLIQGESGTGKELVARLIHERSARRDRPFVAQNCSALNDNLLESALFGHVRGAFTGAVRDAKGLFEQADDGTLLLDEIGDMSPALQSKLLRVLQEGTYSPVGSSDERRCDVRVLAASHKDLLALVRRGQFREDLYYRVNVLRLDLPPLRARDDDLDLLVRETLRRLSKPPELLRISPEALGLLRAYDWPGNVRELQNELERLSVLAEPGTPIGAALVSPRITQAVRKQPATGPIPNIHDATEELERRLIADALSRFDGNQSKAARELGLARSNFVLKLSKYGLGPRRR